LSSELRCTVSQGLLGKVIGSTSFASIDNNYSQRSQFNEELGSSRTFLQAIEQIAEVAACGLIGLLFLAVGLVHIKYLV
jgi:hypothetical protein